MTKRFQKNVGLSVCPFVTLTKKPTPPLLAVEKLFAYQVKGLTIFYNRASQTHFLCGPPVKKGSQTHSPYVKQHKLE